MAPSLLVKKSLRLHVKIFVTTILSPVYLKKSLYNSIQLRKPVITLYKVETLTHFSRLFSAASESKQRALQASGAMRCVTQCWKVSKSNSSSKHHVSHFQQRLPRGCRSVAWLAPNADTMKKSENLYEKARYTDNKCCAPVSADSFLVLWVVCVSFLEHV